jgi:hypothetical protein
MSLTVQNSYLETPTCEICKDPFKSGEECWEALRTHVYHFPTGYQDTIEPGDWGTDSNYDDCKLVHTDCLTRLLAGQALWYILEKRKERARA